LQKYLLHHVANIDFFQQLIFGVYSGYRYEFYCMSKASKTTQCTVHCEVSINTAWEWNSKRDKEDDRYTRDTFDALTMRFEAPDSRNRWDSPLFTVLPGDKVPTDEVYSVLFERKAPPPNQSTQCVSNTFHLI
jgi:protein KTI12